MFPSFRHLALALTLAVGTAAPPALLAQDPPRARERAVPRTPGAPGARTEEERQALERRFRESLARLVKRELGLSDAQAERLTRVNQQFDGPRRQLVQQEREARHVLRTQLQRGDEADGRRVEGALQELLVVQRRRLELQEREQRALSQFLTPVQRARYLALQENVRRRVDAQRGRQRMPPRPTGGR